MIRCTVCGDGPRLGFLLAALTGCACTPVVSVEWPAEASGRSLVVVVEDADPPEPLIAIEALELPQAGFRAYRTARAVRYTALVLEGSLEEARIAPGRLDRAPRAGEVIEALPPGRIFERVVEHDEGGAWREVAPEAARVFERSVPRRALAPPLCPPLVIEELDAGAFGERSASRILFAHHLAGAGGDRVLIAAAPGQSPVGAFLAVVESSGEVRPVASSQTIVAATQADDLTLWLGALDGSLYRARLTSTSVADEVAVELEPLPPPIDAPAVILSLAALPEGAGPRALLRQGELLERRPDGWILVERFIATGATEGNFPAVTQARSPDSTWVFLPTDPKVLEIADTGERSTREVPVERGAPYSVAWVPGLGGVVGTFRGRIFVEDGDALRELEQSATTEPVRAIAPFAGGFLFGGAGHVVHRSIRSGEACMARAVYPGRVAAIVRMDDGAALVVGIADSASGRAIVHRVSAP